jgi:Tol biopolymer transport system component
MGKLAGTLVVWLLIAALLSACGPGGQVAGTPGGTPTAETSGAAGTPASTATPTGEMGSSQSPSGTPEPSTTLPVCQGRIAFVVRTNGDRQLFVINANGSGLAQVTEGEGSVSYPAWSPDGNRILFVRHLGNSDIYIIESDGTGEVRLTDHPAHDSTPAWSPGGEQVAFISTRVRASDLFLVPAAGGGAVPLTGSRLHKLDFAWAPDGVSETGRIAFTMLDGVNQGEIWVLELAESGDGAVDMTNLTQHPANDCCVDWSPDGEWLLFLSSRHGEGTGSLLPRSGNLLAQAGQDQTSNTASDVVRAVTTVMPEVTEDIYLMRPDGSQLVKLTNGTGRERHASWSPVGAAGGGRIVFVSDLDGRDDIYVIDVQDGVAGTLTRLTDSPEVKGFPAWSHDGACVAFQQYRDNVLELYVVNADGTGLKKLAENLTWGSGMSWTP